MDQPKNPKQEIVETLKNANNVLITVSTNPTVDQLATAIGLTLMLDKLDKHATAVYSGKTPSAIDFLNPGANIHTNTDSLQDFIISLDLAKADKLRYKKEDDLVKIFITPYKTSINESDLTFTQGDVNVDVIVGIGVDQREHLDQAIIAHGRILHDATVVSIMAGSESSSLGSVNWQDQTASSTAEMIVSISEAFDSGLLDSSMATAFLTGIVSETDRFRNGKTTPKVMTMSAQLMSAGANQQLIADNLMKQEPPKPEPKPQPASQPPKPEPKNPKPKKPKKKKEELKIEREERKLGFANEKGPEKPKQEESADVLSFNLHDLDNADVQYGDAAVKEQEEEKTTDKIQIDEHGNMSAAEEAAIKAEVEKKAAATSPEPAPKPEPQEPQEQPEPAPKPEPAPEDSSAAKGGMKVIQPLPPEDQPAKASINDLAAAESEVTEDSSGPTLAKIEQNVVNADEAREQISEAIAGDPNIAPKPVQALNSQPLNEEAPIVAQRPEPQQPQAQVAPSTAPPLPPPPVNPSA